ncbi:MAG: polysaccharide biosynthesis protein [Rickettsiales bacterium]|nr:polysaccharide biosynthesis protein [Rickettsiales bacterium]
MKSRILRNIIAVTHDSVITALSFVAALYLRWQDEMWIHAADYWWQGAALAGVIMFALSLLTRAYRRLWRYVSLKDITELMRLAVMVLVTFYVCLFLTTRLEMLPRSIPLIQALVLVAALCAPRFFYRAFHERRLQLPQGKQVPVLLIGATQDAELFIRESTRSPSFAYRVVGVVATDETTQGRNIHHVRIYGDIDDMPAIIRKLKRKDEAPQRVIIADPHLEGPQVRDILEHADKEGLEIARMPRLTDLTRGDKSKFDVKPIDVEDILGRPQTRLDFDAMKEVITQKVVLVTGAGGSIGSELVRQIASFGPKRIVLLEQGEYNLYQIDRELAERYPDVARKAIIGDVRNKGLLNQVFDSHKPQVVFHAAALKHVPLCEINVVEAIVTNIIGTRNVADMCIDHKVALMVQISTDKAVNPTNIMGACKRLGEHYCQLLGQEKDTTRFITVRFGNVLGSTGSVVPLFEKQIAAGGPITVTHKDMTRYFMTIREAVQLVIQSSAMGVQQTEQPAPIYVLDMGEPIRIEDLALQMIRLSGLQPDKDIKISYVGLRPGEKLHEELFYDNEELLNTTHEAIHLAAPTQGDAKQLSKKMDQLEKAVSKRDKDAALDLLKELVPNYQPNTKSEDKKAS